jgi:nitrous oxidase accessory protein
VRRWRVAVFLHGLAAALLAFFGAQSACAADTTVSLRERIARATAGDTLEVPGGIHQGPFVIDKPLRLLAKRDAVLEGSGKGHVVEIRASDVELAGFVIRRSGANLSEDDAGIFVRGARAWIHDNTLVDTLHGIYLYAAQSCRLERNVIRGRAGSQAIADPLTEGLKLSPQEMCSVTLLQDQRGNGIHIWNCSKHRIVENDIRGTRDGIYFQFCHDARIERNVIQDVRYGLHYMYSDNNVFEGNFFTRNAAGSAIMYSNGITLRGNRFEANRSHRAYGLLMHTVERTRVEDNTINGNTVGVYLENSTANTFRGNRFTSNYIGLRLAESSDENEFVGNVLESNVHAVETGGRNQTNRFATEGRGNYWDEALKLDLDRNGVADLPHRETDLFGAWRRMFPQIGLLSGSPGERAIRFLHTRVHVPGIPGVTDPMPLTNVPES